MRRARGSVSRHVDRAGRVRYRVRLWLDGRRESGGLHDTQEAADAFLAAWLEQFEERPSGLTVGAWGKRWLDQRETDGRHRAVDRDRLRWNRYVAKSELADRLLRKLTRPEVVRWVRQLARQQAVHVHHKGGERVERTTKRRLSRRTVGHALANLRACLSDAVEEGFADENVAMGVRVPKDDEHRQSQDEITFLTAKEVAAVLRCGDIPQEARDVYAVAIYTGLRAGEIWGLRWCDVVLSGDHPRLLVRRSRSKAVKTGRSREVPLLPPAKEALVRVLGKRKQADLGEALVWPNARGRCHATGYDAGWSGSYAPGGRQRDGHRELAGVRREVTFGDLRHTCGSHLVSGTWGRAWSLHEVRDFLGHQSVTTTERYYARLVPGHIHQAAREMGQQWDT